MTNLMSSRALKVAMLLVAVVALTACAQARWVERDGSGGTIAIPSAGDEASREKAYEMADGAWGPGAWEIVWEGQIEIGEQRQLRGSERSRSASASRTDSAAVGASSTSGGTTTAAGASTTRSASASASNTRYGETETTQKLYEYHIKFKKK